MDTTQLRRARRLFTHPDVPRHVTRHNIRSWVRSVRHLGDAWLLATPIQRKGN